MSQTLRHIVATVAVVLATMVTAWGGNVTFRAKLDSATLLMGKTTALHLEITQDKNARGFFPGEQLDTLSAMVEIAERPAADTTDLGNNRIQINRDLIIQSFDSGMWVIKPIPYVVNGDTAYCNQLSLKVMPVDVSKMKDINDIKPVEAVPFNLLDWLPDYWWAWLLGLLLIGAAIWAYLKYFKKGVNPLKPVKKRLPPYEEAMLNLQNLKAAQLWQQGKEKEYFTGLTDILRVYIDRRFGINAVEMTSSQIIDTLKKNEETKAVNEQLEMILEVADIVKFAKARPLADDNEVAFQRAVNFVEATRPVEQPEKKEEVKK
ncbi:MAG: cell wall anchor protein [Muribaculaceae bacterium]|nr:cell wall anchor protein [Muribaculaceae bacterium]